MISLKKARYKGFTLAELLIALGILGVIATFTIPKVLNASQSSQNTAIAKEAASMVSGSYSAYSLNNTVATGTTAGVLTQYMNYVAMATNAEALVTSGAACSGTAPCLKLHNGGVLQYGTANTVGGTSSTNGITFNLDPDSTGTQTPCTFIQYYNGRLTTVEAAGGAGSVTSGAAGAATSVTTDPTYIVNWN